MRTLTFLTTSLTCAATLTLAAVQPPTPTPKPASTARTVANDIVIADTTIRWMQDVTVSAEVDGKLERRIKNEGDEVKKGDALAELDATVAKLAERERRADLEHLTLEVADADTRLDESKAQRDASRRLRERNAINPEEFRLAEVRVELAKNQVTLKRKEEEKAAVLYERAKVELDRHTVRSPIDGRIMECLQPEGTVLERVGRNGLQLFRIVRTDRVRVEGLIELDKYDYRRVRKYQEVTVKLALPPTVRDSRLRADFKGEVTFVGKLDANSQEKQVWAEIDNPDGLLEDGLQATLTIHTGERSEQVKN